jgi:hypothetical protein
MGHVCILGLMNEWHSAAILLLFLLNSSSLIRCDCSCKDNKKTTSGEAIYDTRGI